MRFGRAARIASLGRPRSVVASIPAAVRPTADRDRTLEWAAKRVLDLCILDPAAVIALHVVAIAALWVAAVSPGNPFYFQTCEGHGGSPIRVWKIRTMHPDAEALIE